VFADLEYLNPYTEHRKPGDRMHPYLYFLLFLASLPWLVPAVGLLMTIDRRRYPVWIGDLLLVLTGFIGLAGLVGQTALRTWMVSRTIIAPMILWALAAAFLPRRASGNAEPKESSILPHIFFVLAWGGWMAWNASVLMGAIVVRHSQEGGNIGKLGSIRSALTIYKDDKGAFPAHLDELVQREAHYKKWLLRLAPIATEDRILHPQTSWVQYFDSLEPNDGGGLGYVNSAQRRDGSKNPDFGRVFINCTHLDVVGRKRLSEY
jgi:hypothetical protein